MTPAAMMHKAVQHASHPSGVELVTHAFVVVAALVCATILGLHGDLNSGDILAVFTTAITGTAAVAGVRAGRREAENAAQQQQATDEANA